MLYINHKICATPSCQRSVGVCSRSREFCTKCVGSFKTKYIMVGGKLVKSGRNPCETQGCNMDVASGKTFCSNCKSRKTCNNFFYKCERYISTLPYKPQCEKCELIRWCRSCEYHHRLTFLNCCNRSIIRKFKETHKLDRIFPHEVEYIILGYRLNHIFPKDITHIIFKLLYEYKSIIFTQKFELK